MINNLLTFYKDTLELEKINQSLLTSNILIHFNNVQTICLISIHLKKIIIKKIQLNRTLNFTQTEDVLLLTKYLQ